MQRRDFILAVTAAAVVPAAFAQSKPMKIGVVGSGRIGSTLGGLWVKAGHEVMFSDRDPEQVKRAIEGLGPESRSRARRRARKAPGSRARRCCPARASCGRSTPGATA